MSRTKAAIHFDTPATGPTWTGEVEIVAELRGQGAPKADVSLEREVDGPGPTDALRLARVAVADADALVATGRTTLPVLGPAAGFFPYRGPVVKVRPAIRVRLHLGRKLVLNERVTVAPPPLVAGDRVPRPPRLAGLRWGLWRVFDHLADYWFWSKLIFGLVAAGVVFSTTRQTSWGALVAGLVALALVGAVAWGPLQLVRGWAAGALDRLRFARQRPDVDRACLGDPLPLPDLSRQGLAWRLVQHEEAWWKTGPKGQSRRRDLEHRAASKIVGEAAHGEPLAVPAAGPPSFQTARHRIRWTLELYKPHDPEVCARYPLHVAYARRAEDS